MNKKRKGAFHQWGYVPVNFEELFSEKTTVYLWGLTKKLHFEKVAFKHF